MHVLAYEMGPSYQSHRYAANEKAAIKRVLKRLRPDSYAKVLIELNSFKQMSTSLTNANGMLSTATIHTCGGTQWATPS